MKTNIAVFYGCRSVEHEVSIISAVQAMRAISREKYEVTPIYVTKEGAMRTGSALFDIESYKDMTSLYKITDEVTVIKTDSGVVMRYLNSSLFSKKKDVELDLAFPIVHGTNCEDGAMAGLFEFLGLPYISCDILSAAVGMDKAVFKSVLKQNGLPCLDCVSFRARRYRLDREAVINEIAEKIGFPLIIKPINLGSSVGISKVNDISELSGAIELSLSFADTVLAERAISPLREINCSVIGDADECEASVCEEPFMHDEILSYKDKYLGGTKSGEASKGMASLGRKIPADISKEKEQEIKSLSCDIFKALGCSGVVRIDFLMNSKTGEVFANEINTIPGSLAFYLWEASGLKYTDMIDKLVSIAFRRQRMRDNLTYTIDTNILSGASFGAKGAKGAKL